MDLNQITLSVRDLQTGIGFLSKIGLRLNVHNPEGR